VTAIDWKPALLAFGLSLFLALLLTPVARVVGSAVGWVSRPRPDRWNVQPVGKSLLGGAAMLTAFWVSLLVTAHALPGWGWKILFAGGAAFAIIGFIDDRLEFRPSTKIFYQVLAALVPVMLGLRIAGLSPVLTQVLAIAWIVCVVNAVNLLDNMDGLAAGVTGIAAVFLAYHGYLNGQLPTLLAAACLAGACFGFLRYNFPPSTVYMGDAGSHFLGYTLAVLCLLSVNMTGRTVTATLLVPVLVLLVPIFDTALVAVTRFASGRSVTAGATDHSSHRLISLGLSERHTAIVTYALALVGGGLSIMAPRASLSFVAVVVLLVAIALYYFGTFLSRAPVELKEPTRIEDARRNRMAIFDAFVPFKWGILDVVADLAVVIVSYIAAYLLRYEGLISDYNAFLLQRSLPILIACRLIAFRVFGLYRKVHGHFGIADVLDAGKAILASSSAFVVILVVLYRFEDYSRAVMIMDAVITFGLIVVFRTSLNFFQELFTRSSGSHRRRTVIVGAGSVGGALVRVLRHDPDIPRQIIAFIDDDPGKVGRRLSGVPIHGTSKLSALLRDQEIDEIVLTIKNLGVDSERIVQAASDDLRVTVRRAFLE
jgi:UDP-GlcNAc:undecaprenyl-phosphate/decaprenyl-phosphate GlcNAc-1-phosphate transferase